MSPTTAPLARIETNRALPPDQLRTVFLDQQPDLERMYPPHLKQAAARLARAVITEVAKSPQLQKCTAQSLLSCAVQAATLNLEIGGPLGQAFMVPYSGAASFQIGYRGLITLAYRSNKVASITAQIVHEGDTFKVQYGTQPGIIHEPGTKRGAITHYYAVVSYKGGGIDFEVMTVQQVDMHRQKFSKQGNDNQGRPAGIWAAHYDAMSLKTVLRKVLKRAPIGVDLGQDEMDEGNGLAAFPTNDPLPMELPSHDEHGEITETSGIPSDDLPPDLKARAAEIAHERNAMGDLMTGKGWNWEACIAWINREFEEQRTIKTKLTDLAPNQRIALAEHLLALPNK